MLHGAFNFNVGQILRKTFLLYEYCKAWYLVHTRRQNRVTPAYSNVSQVLQPR